MQWCIENEKLEWIIDVNIWCPPVQVLEFVQCQCLIGHRLTAVINDRCPNTNAFNSFIHKMGIFFIFTSYAQQIQRQTCSKPQTKFLHRFNPASHFKMPHPPKATLYVCSPVSHSERSFYSNLILAEWHKPCSEYYFWQIPTSPLNKLHFFSSLKLHQQDYRIKKVTPKTQETTKHPTYTGSLFSCIKMHKYTLHKKYKNICTFLRSNNKTLIWS